MTVLPDNWDLYINSLLKITRWDKKDLTRSRQDAKDISTGREGADIMQDGTRAHWISRLFVSALKPGFIRDFASSRQGFWF
jgi:hypothetical protein